MAKVVLIFNQYVRPVDGPECIGYSGQEFNVSESDARILIDDGIAERIENVSTKTSVGSNRASGKRSGTKRVSANRQQPRRRKNSGDGNSSRKNAGKLH